MSEISACHLDWPGSIVIETISASCLSILWPGDLIIF